MIRVEHMTKDVTKTRDFIVSSDDTYDPSGVIEAILLQFPLPIILLDTGPYPNVVLLGGNIVSAIQSFMDSDGVTVLTNLKFKNEYEGKTYSELPLYEQRRIEEYKLDFACVQPGPLTEDIDAVVEIYRGMNDR